jgi:hypothetical protein
VTPKLYTLEDVDPNWSQRWRLGAEMDLPVSILFLHHTVTVPTANVLRDAAKVNDIDQQRFGKISYSWNVHALSGDWIEAETTHRGAHTIDNRNRSYNGTALGIGIIGNLQPDVPGVPTNTVTDMLIESIAAGIDAFVRPHLNEGFWLLGHRNVFSTACDGDLLYERHDDIRALLGHAQPPTPLKPPEVEQVKFVYVRHHSTKPGESGTNDPRVFCAAVGFHATHVVDFLDTEHAVAEGGNFVWIENPDATEEVTTKATTRKVQIVGDVGATLFNLPTQPAK